jgi:hypothetical protein
LLRDVGESTKRKKKKESSEHSSNMNAREIAVWLFSSEHRRLWQEREEEKEEKAKEEAKARTGAHWFK